jgi:hypothetical protein
MKIFVGSAGTAEDGEKDDDDQNTLHQITIPTCVSTSGVTVSYATDRVRNVPTAHVHIGADDPTNPPLRAPDRAADLAPYAAVPINLLRCKRTADQEFSADRTARHVIA